MTPLAGRSDGELVSRFVSLLGASRHGLSQQELVDLLSPGDPQGNVAALAQLLRPYLMQRGELLDFYHGQFHAAAEEAWLKTNAERQVVHARLAGYFRSKADPAGNGRWAGQYARGWSELAFHMFHEGRTVELQDLLTNYLWMRGRLLATDVLSLIRRLRFARAGSKRPAWACSRIPAPLRPRTVTRHTSIADRAHCATL